MFLKNKILRLILPFVFAVVVFLIPRLYLTQDFSNFTTLATEKGEVCKTACENKDKTYMTWPCEGTRCCGLIEWNYSIYYRKMLPQFLFKMSWLWFLLALFIDSLISYPFLKWTQRRKLGKQMNFKDDGLSIVGQIVIYVIWTTIQIVLGGRDLGIRYLLP